jgi:hypothetical protein
MIATPMDVPGEPEPNERLLAVGVGEVRQGQLEPIRRIESKGALKIERAQRPIGRLRAAGSKLGCEADPFSNHRTAHVIE